MNKSKLLELTKVNLRYANPQTTNKARKAGKSGQKLTRYIINQYLLSGVIFLVIYGMMMFFIDFSKMPGFFTYYVGLFGIIAFSQGISVIYNVFFESQDLAGYLPLPFRQGDIFLAKLIVVALTIIPFTLPALIVFILTGMHAGIFIVLAIFLALLMFALFLSLIFAVCSFIVFGLTRTKFFKKHKKLVTSLLLVLSVGIAVTGILLMQAQSPAEYGLDDRAPITVLLPIFYAMAAPFSLNGLLSWGGIIALNLAFVLLIKIALLPKLYEQLLDASPGVSSERRKHKGNQNLRQLLFGYNSQLIRDPNLIMQVFSNSILMPLIFVITFAVTGQFDLSFLDYTYLGAVFFAGVAFAVISVNQMSFVANMISLDKENFLFVRSLPLDMRLYLKEKFRFGCALQLVINLLIVVITGLTFHLPLLHLLSLALGNLIATYLLSLRYFVRDYRLLLLSWTNISQLFTRGAGNLGMVLMMMGTMFGSSLLLVLYVIGVTTFSSWLIDLPALLIFSVICFISYDYYQRNFWQHF